jgi:WD40 repeat protein
MGKYMIKKVLLMFLLLINIITVENAHAQSVSDSTITDALTTIASSENNAVKIIGIDSTSFPMVKANILINKSCALAGNLKNENFEVQEKTNDVEVDNLYFTGKASGQKLDLAVIFDDTGSMGEEISAMKSKVKGLTDTLKASGIDANYSLVSFKDSVSVKTNWTDDPEVFKRQVNFLQAQGGNDEPEVSLDAIDAVLSMGFRPDAQKVILVITDAHAHYKDDGSNVFSNCTKEEIEKNLKGSGIVFIPVSPTFEIASTDVDLRKVANDIQSMWIDIKSADFIVILEQIQGILTGTYVIEYTSPDLTPSENRTVLVSVDKLGCVKGSVSSSYTTPGSVISLHGTLSISGRAFDDSNGDGVETNNEVGLESWDVLLDGPDGYSATAKTDRKGYYIFTGLLPGTYKLATTGHENWTATAPADGINVAKLTDTHESEVNFGFILPYSYIELMNAVDLVHIALSPDGQILASSDDNNTIRLWDVKSGNELRALKGHAHGILSLAFSPNGQILASGANDGDGIRLWDVESGNELRALKSGPVKFCSARQETSVIFSPDGQTLVSGGDGAIRLWDVASGTEIRFSLVNPEICESVSELALSPNGQTLVSGGYWGMLRIWDVESGNELHTLKDQADSWIMGVAFSPDGQTLASVSAGRNSSITLWDVVSGNKIRTWEGRTNKLFSVEFSPDGQTLAVGELDGTITLWDVENGNELHALEGHASQVVDVEFSPDGLILASSGEDGRVLLWRLR